MKNKKYLKTLNPAPFHRVFTMCRNLSRYLFIRTAKVLNIRERCGIKFLGLALCVFGFFMTINTSHAALLDIAGKSIIDIFSWGITIVLYILSTIFASVLMIGGWVFDWTLNLNSAILSNPAVRVGWPIARDIANLGFILVMLIIAFSTILRMGDFTAKKALPKLIIAALLINFSLLFVGIFLDFTNIITNFFINQGITGAGNGVGISQAIIGMMNVVGLLQPPTTLGAASFTTFGAGMLTFITNLFFVNILTAITAITMWSMAAMFLVRYVMLGLLIILLPLAILAYVLGRSEWGDWMKQFIAKALFAPIASLFIYLAIATAQEFGAMQISAQQASAAPGLSGITANIGSMIMTICILLFGLGLAEKISGIASVGGRAFAEKAIGFIGKAATKPYRLFGKAAGTAGLMAGAEKAEKLGLSRIGRGTRFEGLLRPLRQLGATAKEYTAARGNAGIPMSVFEEITGGYGAKNRKFRIQEEKQFKSEDKEAVRLAKKMVYFDPSQAGNTEYMTKYNAELAEAQKQIRAEIEAEFQKPGGDIKKVAEKFDRLSMFRSLAKSAGILNEGIVEKFFKDNGEDMEITKKYFEREATIKNLMGLTLATRQQTEDALKNNLGDLKSAKKDLEKFRKQNEERIAKETKETKEKIQEDKDEAHKDFMDNGFPRT